MKNVISLESVNKVVKDKISLYILYMTIGIDYGDPFNVMKNFFYPYQIFCIDK